MQWQLVLYKDHRGGRSWPPYQTSRGSKFWRIACEKWDTTWVDVFGVSLGQNLPPKKEKTYTAPTLGEDLVLSHSGLNKKLPAESQAIDKHRIFRSLRKEITSQSADVKRRYTFFGAWFQHAMSQPTLQHVEKAREQVLQNPYFQPRIRWLKLTGQVFGAPIFRFPLLRHSEFFLVQPGITHVLALLRDHWRAMVCHP